MNKAYTLVEILIVISILALLGIASIYFFNPVAQIKKTRDVTRKDDLAMVKRALEDFYNDKGRYPKPLEICYDYNSVVGRPFDSYGRPAAYCHICSTNKKMESNYAYFSQIPSLNGKAICDPLYPNSDYLYDFDNADFSNNHSQVSWARVYTKLQYLEDHSIDEVECAQGCGPKGSFVYNYGITTNNVDLERATSQKCGQVGLYQLDNNGICNLCRGNDGNSNCSLTKPVYTDRNCTDGCQL